MGGEHNLTKDTRAGLEVLGRVLTIETNLAQDTTNAGSSV
jgi:hypothetical protein